MSWTFPFARSNSLIGVDVSGRWMKAVQYEGARPAASARVARKDPERSISPADAATLAGVLERAGFKGQRVVIAPPRENIIAEVLELPPRGSGAPIEQLARMEVARTHKCDPASFEIGLWDLPPPGRGGELSHVFAAALPLSKSEPLLDTFESAGLEVHAIDVPAAALARAYGIANLPDAMLDVGWTDAMLCVVHEGAVVYERRIAEAGLCHLFANVTTRLGMAADAAEAVLMSSVDSEDRRQGALAQELRGPFVEYLEVVASELHRSLAYMAHRYQSWQFKRLSISGDGSNITGLREKLTDALQVAVSTGPQPTSIDPALLIAAGAARFSISGTSMKEAA